MEIVLSDNSKKQLKKLNARIQQKILFTLENFAKPTKSTKNAKDL